MNKVFFASLLCCACALVPAFECAALPASGIHKAGATVSPDAPAAARDVTAEFAPGSLSGQICFTAPNKTYGDDDLSGNINYIIAADGKTLDSGKVYSGVYKMVDVTMNAVGFYDFTVTLSNESGNGPAVTVRKGVGYAAPATPEVTARLAGTSAEITWDAITTTDGGKALADAVTYRVVRYPDSKVIEEATAATSATDSELGTTLAAYSYGVTAICNDTPSAEGLSATIVSGAASLPYLMTFEEKSDMDYFTIIDSNRDGCTWDFYYGEVRSQASDDRDADDWLMSPAMAMEAGKFYMVSIDGRVYSPDYPGKFEVMMGDAPTPEAMTTRIIAPSEVRTEPLTTFRGLAAPQGSGNKYLGIHSITEAGNWWLFATNLSVSAAYEPTAPAAPTAFSAVSAADGARTVDITLTAPLKDLAGNDLVALTSLDVYRDGALIHSTPNPTPGQTVSFTDEEAGEGSHTYTASAANATGRGVDALASGFAGVNLPAAVTEAYAYSTDVPGEVIVEWKPVTTFIDGTPMDESLVTYCIYTNVTGNDMKILEGLTGTSAKFQIMYPTDEQPQMFMQFGVTAETAGGENTKGVLTEFVGLGEAYELPYEDSFADLKMNYLSMMGGSDAFAYWDNASDTTFEEVQSQDDDNGLLAMFSQYIGSWAYFRTGIIDLADATNPVLTFYVYNYFTPEIANHNTIEVQIGRYARFESVKTVTLSDFGAEGWHRVEVPLTDYLGQQIQVNLIGTTDRFQWMHIDNFKVMDRKQKDLAITAVNVPARVKAGNTAPVAVQLANLGLDDVPEFTLELLRDTEVIDSKTFKNIESDLRFSHTFSQLHSVASPESVDYQVVLTYEADGDPANNESAILPVITIFPNYPAVTDLTATYAEGNTKAITLQWSQPDLTADYADDITEGFEGAASWTSKVEGWTMVDADRKYIYGFNFFNVPATGPQPNTQWSWFVMDDTWTPMAEHFSDPNYYEAHSGHRYIGSMAVTDGTADYIEQRVDDWAISPELYGGAQTISFWAKSMLADCFETVEVLYSTTGKDVADFTSVAKFEKIPWTWTQYYAELPAGARYFALRNTSRDEYVAMIDDVNFTPAEQVDDLAVSGYNIYRDGKQINDAPVASTTYADECDSALNPVYTVTALYVNRGESAFSNAATPELTGLEGVAAAAVRVFASAGCINIIGAEGLPVAVYGIDGRTVSACTGTGRDAIAVAPGAYIVRTGSTVHKLSVR